MESREGGLKQGVLSPLETLAQSIAGIAPSATPGMLIPIVFSFAGNGTWLSYLLATIGILFTAQCINEFTARSSSPGSLYTFVREGLSHRAGVVTGWGLMFAYVVCTACCIVEFAVYAGSLSKEILNFQLNSLLMIALGSAMVGWIAYKNIKMSATLMLRLEFFSISLILLIVLLTFWKHGLSIDPQQMSLSNVSFNNVRMGLVMAIFGFAAFESSASLGVEAASPLTSIPRAIMRSVIFSGLFFVVAAYALVLSFHGAPQSLDKCATPLLAVTSSIGMPQLGHIVDGGIMVSFFAAAIANLNAAARAVYQMSQDGVLHGFLGRTHPQNYTPHTAVIACAIVGFLIAVILAAYGFAMLDIVGWLGTLATFGFIFGYITTSIAAGKLLKAERKFSSWKIVVVGLSLLVLVSSLFSFLGTATDSAYSVLPYIFLAYMGVGLIFCFLRTPPPVVALPESVPVDLSNS